MSDAAASTEPPDDVADEDLEVAASPSIGDRVLAEAQRLVGLREFKVNEDEDGKIRAFFIDGLRWSPKEWDEWPTRHPSSPVRRPEWCAAMAAWCLRRACDAASASLPLRPSASASTFAERAASKSRLLPPESTALARPGDIVVWHGHVGVLASPVRPDGGFDTVEGNTWTGSPRRDGVYARRRDVAEVDSTGLRRLVGFVSVS